MDFATAVPAGLSGALLTLIGRFILAYIQDKYRSSKSDSYLKTKLSIEEKHGMTEQFSALIKASETYRDEVRQDMVRMRQELDVIKKDNIKELSGLNLKYSVEMKILKDKISTLTDEISRYRLENAALHSFLKEKQIEVPTWIRGLNDGH